MKGLRKKVLIILVIAILLVIIMQVINFSIDKQSASPDFDDAPEEIDEMVIENELAFVCPINCEDGATFEEPGNCPVCDMPLKALNEKEINQSQIIKRDSINPAKDKSDNGSSDQN